MQYDLEKKIEDFSEEIFTDLGLATLSEDDKADVYARVQDSLHKVILAELRPLLPKEALSEIRLAIEQEDYYALDSILDQYPQFKETLDDKIDEDLENLKSTISEEQSHAGNSGN